MKKFLPLALCLAALTALLCMPASAAQGDFEVKVNGQTVTFTDAAPKLADSRSFLPLVATFQALGFDQQDMTWDADTATVTAAKGDVTISLTEGKQQITVTRDGQTSTIDTDVAPFIDPDTSRTYVPFGLVADALDFKVGWDGENGVVLIDDVDAILAANTETYKLMDQYMAYGKSYAEKNYKITGSYAADMSLNMTEGGQASTMGLTMEGVYNMVSAGSTAFQFATDMTVDVAAQRDGKDVLDEVLSPEEQAMFPLSIDMDMRGDLKEGMFYLRSDALTQMVTPGAQNMWYQLDMKALFDQMSDLLGMDYAALLELATGYVDMSFEAYLDATLRAMPLSSADATTADLLAMFNAMFGDSAFQKSGSDYVNTMDLDGLGQMVFTLNTKSSAVVGYAMEISVADPSFGGMKIAASMKDDKLEMSMGVDMAMAQEQDAAFSISMDMTMDGVYKVTNEKPDTQPPAGAGVIDLVELMAQAA